eukprot:295380_1
MAQRGCNGYDQQIFLNQQEAEKYLCVICRSVCKEPTNIGCDEEHIFCKQCLIDYFKGNSVKSCPSCRYRGLKMSNTRSSKFIGRVVDSLRVKCQLQYETVAKQRGNRIQCKWEGDLSSLSQHITKDCPLYPVVCKHCNVRTKRGKLNQHVSGCSEVKLPCDLQCKQMIKRKLMKEHINNECEMKQLRCDECKENVLRKDMNDHVTAECPEYEIDCTFASYGCTVKVKRRLINVHLQNEEIAHLKMQLNSFQSQLINVRNGQLKSKILLLLKSKNGYLCDVKTKTKDKQEDISSFTKWAHDRYCIGKDIGFNNSRQIGFSAKDIDVFGNNIVFGTSQKRVSAVCLDTNKCLSFEGDIQCKNYHSVYSHDAGLILVGGRDPNNEDIPNHWCFSAFSHLKHKNTEKKCDLYKLVSTTTHN